MFEQLSTIEAGITIITIATVMLKTKSVNLFVVKHTLSTIAHK